MMRLIRVPAFVLALTWCVPVTVWAASSGTPAALPPDQVVQQTAQQMINAINAKGEELKQHPQELYDLVGKILLPHFDFTYASQLVLGPYWRSATPAQRQAFQEAFYRFLVNSYSNGLLQGNYSERNLKVEPWRGDVDDKYAFVRTQVLRADAPPVHVVFSMVRTPQGWKAFDLSIEGVSYVMNYRNQFGPEIQQKGLNALIARLNTDARKPPPKANGS